MNTSFPPVEAFAPPPELAAHARRLQFVTGFVTSLCPPEDRRPLALARFFHVARVAALADFIARRQPHPTVDFARVSRLAWLHDMNRWPFAHNAERPGFDQSADIARFLHAGAIATDTEQTLDLIGIIDKEPAALSHAARIVLLADILAGFVEDALWSATAIDLHPSFIPADVAHSLLLPLQLSAFTDRLLQLNLLLFETRDPGRFMVPFNALFMETAATLIEHRGWARTLPFGDADFESARRLIKEHFMRGMVFPYNNVKVSKGPLLKQRLVDPFLDRFGAGGSARLTSMTEPEFLRAAIDLRIVARQDMPGFYPELDYVATHERDLSFRARAGRT